MCMVGMARGCMSKTFALCCSRPFVQWCVQGEMMGL